jgi:hypothetical protein
MGEISDYFRKRNGMSYSYCQKCNCSTQHINGICQNEPTPSTVRPLSDPRLQKKNKPPYYDITNIRPSTDPDDQ